MSRFRYSTHLPFSPEQVFDWYMRPGALERLTPPWAQVRVLEREGGIQDGGRIVLGIKQGPAEIKWEVRHTEFQEGRQFRDEQISGPLEKWDHTHRFTPADDGGCVLEDDIEWAAPLGSPGQLFAEGFIERELDRLFSFRHVRLQHDLKLHSRYGGKPLTVVLTGGSGLIGSSLSDFLTSGGHTVVQLSRGKETSGGDGPTWDPEGGYLDPAHLRGADAVVHLAGESLAALRWSDEKKERILESRRKGTELIARTLAGMRNPPSVFVSADICKSNSTRY